ncbi:MAG: NAD-glutamate dehydrogenase domain-containing protein [Pseudomonadota bacterium]|nr:NAD-glutamate dehydrogenase domain-containing protein [Pseudomonadota bacterium]
MHNTPLKNKNDLSRWRRKLERALVRERGASAGLATADDFSCSFPTSYRETFKIPEVVSDIKKIEKIRGTEDLSMNLYRPRGLGQSSVRFQVFHAGSALPLSDVLPMLENMGLKVIDEIPYVIQLNDGQVVWKHDFGMISNRDCIIGVTSIKRMFEETFLKVWEGKAENDPLNSLVCFGGLGWRQVVLLRSYGKYLRQIMTPFTLDHMAQTLSKNNKIARDLVLLFEKKFDPGLKEKKSSVRLLKRRIIRALDSVLNIDDDRILRHYFNLIDVTLRTNFFQKAENGDPKNYISIKFDSPQIAGLPSPTPKSEIFVYSPRMEGIHLRGGKVARGGIRWSDRMEDYRAETLDLMKSQMTKNAVIVPVGAKGGFILKQPPINSSREAFLAEGIACYKILISGMLDITDNIVSSKIVRPREVVCLDGEDPYLVVAADKGTATFSDIANDLALQYGFWLDDAFASGGSAGYDHKKMGITARGAWESVKRHFREIGINTETDEFSVVGVGDMSGDVFGNGMLLSKKIKLIAAFNHKHIFIDPDPDSAISWKERKRLFRIKDGEWIAYNKALISEGGGVFDRSIKSIKLTPEIQELFELSDKNSINPDELIKAIISCKSDLLWLGGIGTYIKSSQEAHTAVGDRRNDAIRIDGRQLRCRVIGEGANLGLTQYGRIEYSLKGGHVNTDFIDNSAGVASSDQEVNIKILLRELVADKKLTRKDRDLLLGQMTENVSKHVLQDNYRQSMALSNLQAFGTGFLDEAARLIKTLERKGKLERQIEFLPGEDELEERKRQRARLTRPEMSVLLAYAKMTLYEDLLHTTLPDDPWLVRDIGLYFPPKLTQKYERSLAFHPLRREISATYITNSLVNRMGPTFINELAYETTARLDTIVRSYLMTRRVFGLKKYWAAIEALDNKVTADIQTDLHLQIFQLARRGTKWFIKNQDNGADVANIVATFGPGVSLLDRSIANYLSEEIKKNIEKRTIAYTDKNVPVKLALGVAQTSYLFAACDIVSIVEATSVGITDAAKVYFNLGDRYGFDFYHEKLNSIVSENEWQSMSIASITDELYASQAKLTEKVVNYGRKAGVGNDLVESWEATRNEDVVRVRNLVGQLKVVDRPDLVMLSVVSGNLRGLTKA